MQTPNFVGDGVWSSAGDSIRNFMPPHATAASTAGCVPPQTNLSEGLRPSDSLAHSLARAGALPPFVCAHRLRLARGVAERGWLASLRSHHVQSDGSDAAEESCS